LRASSSRCATATRISAIGCVPPNVSPPTSTVQIDAGEDVLARLARIVVATHPQAQAAAPVAPALPDPRAVLAAAHSFAERARSRVTGCAA